MIILKRLIKLVAIVLASKSALCAADPVLPTTTVTLSRTGLTVPEAIAELATQTGFVLDASSLPKQVQIPTKWERLPTWAALEQLADLTQHRVVVRQPGSRVAFEAGRTPMAVSVDGPFRVQAREVLVRADLIRGSATYDMLLDVVWEPQLVVFRIDSVPTLRHAHDDRGRKLSARTVSAKSAVTSGSHQFELRLDGLTRESKSIVSLTADFRVTAAPKMLNFDWNDWQQLPMTLEQDGVKATIASVRKLSNVWEIAIALEYPPSMPNFESFESWTSRNRLKLVSSDRTRTLEPVNTDETLTGRTATLAYRFAADRLDLATPAVRREWQLRYETPANMIEQRVSVSLAGVRLP